MPFFWKGKSLHTVPCVWKNRATCMAGVCWARHMHSFFQDFHFSKQREVLSKIYVVFFLFDGNTCTDKTDAIRIGDLFLVFIEGHRLCKRASVRHNFRRHLWSWGPRIIWGEQPDLRTHQPTERWRRCSNRR